MRLSGVLSMRVLALEFSSPLASVAVVQTPGQPCEASHGVGREVIATEVTRPGGRGADALGIIEDALRQAQLEREEVTCLAVGLGPGSYSGIRSAIAIAQGWQLARGVKLLGLSSADALAAEAGIQEL